MLDTVIFRGPPSGGPHSVMIMTFSGGVLPVDGEVRQVPESHTFFDLPANEIILAESGGGETFITRASYRANISVWEMERDDLVEIINQMGTRYRNQLETRTLVFGFPSINPAELF